MVVDPNKYWINGEPILTIDTGLTSDESNKYFLNGEPIPGIFPSAAPPVTFDASRMFLLFEDF